MKLRYETGLATMTQFIVIGVLNLIYAITTSAQSCVKGEDCVSDTILAIAYFVLISFWFIFIATLGYAAQKRRSKRLSQVLIGAEAMIAFVAIFNLRHPGGALGILISIVDLIFAVWIILLAFRLMRTGGGRIKVKSRARKRPTSPQL